MNKIRLFVLSILLLGLFSSSVTVHAQSTPYDSFTPVAGRDYLAQLQNLYEPVNMFSQHIEKPEDIFYFKDRLYVADSGAQAILVYDTKGNFITTIGADFLSAPMGVFVSSDFIYVADYQNEICYKLSHSGTIVQEYVRPDTPLFGSKEPYKPMKVSVNQSGDLYIISEGSTNGIIQINERGEFLGYFGVNSTSLSFRDMMQRMLGGQEKRSQLFAVKPPSPENISIDDQGLVYTITNNTAESERIKKLSIAGKNVLDIGWAAEGLTDITVDAMGNMFVVSELGILSIYDSFGHLLGNMMVNDTAERLGVFQQASGICADQNRRLYITDKTNATITILETTEIANHMFEGVSLYKEGLYLQSMDIWNEVLALNVNFSLAHQALGKAYYKQQDYAAARESFRRSADIKGYSDAFWELRNDWLTSNLTSLFALLVLLLVIKRVLRHLDRKRGIYDPVRRIWHRYKATRVYDQLRTPFYMLRHPIDAIEYIKRSGKISYAAFLSMFAAYLISAVLSEYVRGFVFTGNVTNQVNIVVILLTTAIPVLAFVFSNYLVSTITDGEGTFKQVITGYMAALSPIYLFALPLSLLTNVLTLNESFIFQFGTFFLTLWFFCNLFFTIKDIHNYSVQETVKNLLLTVFGMVILLLVIFITYVLFDQVIQFVVNFR